MTDHTRENVADMLVRYWPIVIVVVGGLLTGAIANYRIGVAERDLAQIQTAQQATNTVLNQLTVQLAVQNGDIKLILSRLDERRRSLNE